jgi:hypothetical protein
VTSVTAQHIGDLILISAFECIDFFGKGEDGHVKLPRIELRIERIVPVENPQARSESRANAIATSGATSLLVHTEQIPDATDTIRKRWAEVSALTSVSKLIATLRECGPGPNPSRSLMPPKGMSHLDNYCATTLSDAIIRIERGKELANWSCASGERILQAVNNPNQLSTVMAPLVNFYAEGMQPIVLTDHVRIRPATEDEIEEFGIRASIIGYSLTTIHGAIRFRPVLWVAETSFTTPPDDGTPALKAFQELDNAVAALGVLGDPFFDYPIAAVTNQPYSHASHGQPNRRTPAFDYWSPFEDPFVLRASGTDHAVTFVRRVIPILEGAPPKGIKISVSRLRQASTRANDTDMVLDGVIAMEAVLLRDHEKDRSFRLATRASILVGDEPEERKKIYDLVFRLNVGRGDVLHGREETTQGMSAKEILTLSRRVVRRVVDETTTRNLEALIVDLDRRVYELSTSTADPLGVILAVELQKRRDRVRSSSNS